MWIEILVAVIAIAFVVLVFYVVITLKVARSSMEQVNQTLKEIQLEMKGLSLESQKLIVDFQQVTEKVLTKVHATDALFQSIKQAGESVSQVTGAVKQVSATVSQSLTDVDRAVHTSRQKSADLLEWTIAGIHLWQHWKGSRNARKDTDYPK